MLTLIRLGCVREHRLDDAAELLLCECYAAKSYPCLFTFTECYDYEEIDKWEANLWFYY